MNKLVESSTRNAIDFFHFAVVFFGIIFLAAGVVMTSPVFTAFGMLIAAFGIIYFVAQA